MSDVRNVGAAPRPANAPLPDARGGGHQVTGGHPIGGAKPNFFKAAGKAVGKAFANFGEAVRSLKAGGQTSRPGPSDRTTAALSNYMKLRQDEADPSNGVSKKDLKEAKDELRKAMISELRGSSLHEAALQDGRKTIFSNTVKGFHSDDPAQSLEDAVVMQLLAKPDCLEKFQKSGLSVTEATAIHLYTQGAYSAINAEVRRGRDHESPLMREMRKAIVSGFDKLPPFKPNDTTDSGFLYRCADVPPSQDGKYQPGKIVSDPGFMSTTRDDTFDFLGGGQSHILSIKPREDTKGRDVSWLSESPHETEITFPPGVKMKVLLRDTGATPTLQTDGTWSSQVGVVLAEV